jgi:dCMP deaminase
MIVIFEGPDGTGKTTLAHELAARLNVPYWNRAHNPLYGMSVETSQQMHVSELDLLLAVDDDVVVDRFFPSEWAYNKTFEREFDEDAVDLLCDRIGRVPHLFVLLYWPVEATFEDIDARTDDEISVDDLRRIDLEYRHFFRLRNGLNLLALSCLRPIGLQIESVMREVIDCRPSIDQLNMNIAREAARRSTCMSRRTGAVLTSQHGHVIATGFNGAPKGIEHQRECFRLRAESYESGSSLAECNDVHAEENAIVQASLSGSSPKGGTLYTINSPCHRCARMLINAQIGAVVYDKLYGDTRAIELFNEANIPMREAE